MTLKIEYEEDGFTPPNPSKPLATTWDKVLWSALTVGRPNRGFVFASGQSSLYEAMFRLSLVRMCLQQTGIKGRVFQRTPAAKSLDPTEKGAVNYFLGMTVAKLFAAELLGTPWLLHLDVFRPQLDAVLSGRSRPDLVGQDTKGDWIAIECKGRVSPPGSDTKKKAKDQAQRIISIGGKKPRAAIGALTYFKNETLRFYWQDPSPREAHNSIKIEHVPGDTWDLYYATTLALVQHGDRSQEQDSVVWSRVPNLDLSVGVDSRVWEALINHGGSAAKNVAVRLHGELGPCNADGVIVRIQNDGIWHNPFVDRGR